MAPSDRAVAQKSHERLYRALGLLPCHAQAASLFLRITGERLTHDMHQWQIAGQERRTTRRAEHGIQAAQRLAGAGYAGDEQYLMSQLGTCCINGTADRIGGPTKIADIGARLGDF